VQAGERLSPIEEAKQRSQVPLNTQHHRTLSIRRPKRRFGYWPGADLFQEETADLRKSNPTPRCSTFVERARGSCGKPQLEFPLLPPKNLATNIRPEFLQNIEHTVHGHRGCPALPVFVPIALAARIIIRGNGCGGAIAQNFGVIEGSASVILPRDNDAAEGVRGAAPESAVKERVVAGVLAGYRGEIAPTT